MSLVDDIFDRHTFDEHDRKIHQSFYSAVKDIAVMMDDETPNCAEKTLAFRALHLALMHFGSALAKNDKYNQRGMHTIKVDELPCQVHK